MKKIYLQHIAPNIFNIALLICLAFHVSGVIGMSLGVEWFRDKTPLNLIISSLLIILTTQTNNKKLLLFGAIAFSIGMITEWIGVNTQYLFGHYYYGDVLGLKILGVPWLIGCNWFVVTFCACMISKEFFTPKDKIGFSLTVATLATAFDFLIEPIAIKLKFWQWLPDNQIPLYNYLCWFIFSFVIAYIFTIIFDSSSFVQNKFAKYLLIIQAIFFLILRFTL